MKAGLRVYYNSTPLTNGGKRWDRGSVFVLRGENRQFKIYLLPLKKLQKDWAEVIALASGFRIKDPT